jgi:hypothetical protein
MKIVEDSLWGVAIQFGNGWTPLFDREYYTKINALIAARKHVKRVTRQQIDPRNIAIFSFARGQIEEVPWS